MSDNKYRMSFTTGGLFQRESLKLTELYLDLGDWNSVRERALAENLLQTRTLSTLKRICREVILRLKTLRKGELDFLVEGSHQEQVYILWISVCRRYRFIAEFAVEVLRERYITLKPSLTHEDFDSFFNRKSEWDLELDKITSTTRSKLRQVLFRMLREADLLTPDSIIKQALLSSRLSELINEGRRSDALYLPMLESDLGRVTQ